MQKKQIVPLFFILITFFSCQKKDMQEFKLNENDFTRFTPVIITTNKGQEEFYSVVIYTNDSQSLKDKGIIVHSESDGFVTALIKREDIKILNNIKSIKNIRFPKTDIIGEPKQEFKKDK